MKSTDPCQRSRPLIQHLVRIADPSESPICPNPAHAVIHLFVSTNHLCGIQQEHGEFYLSEICATYPRLTQRIDGLRETTLLLSCPEAARLVLLNPKLIPSDDAATSNLPRYHRLTGMDSQPARANGSGHQFLWEGREFSLLLLRDRAYPLWQRLILLGRFCKRLDEITRTHQLAVVPHLLREFAATGLVITLTFSSKAAL
jgi:lysine-N-methylase